LDQKEQLFMVIIPPQVVKTTWGGIILGMFDLATNL